jgi:hypothetical protein
MKENWHAKTQRRKGIKFIERERENMKRHSRLKRIITRKNKGEMARKGAKAHRNLTYRKGREG